MAAVDARCYPRAMVPPTRPRATYDDLLAVPEHLVAEIIDGELIHRRGRRRGTQRGTASV